MSSQVESLEVKNGLWTRYLVRKDWGALWLILLLATFLRFNGLNEPGLWLDEAAYTIAAQQPIIDQITNPIHTLRDSIGSADPVLSAIPFSLVLKLGFSNYLARFPAALFGILSVAIFYRLGRTLFGNTVGLIAALLLCTSSFHLLYSQEARSYSQLTFFSIASFWFFYQATTSYSLIYWVLYTISIGAGVSSHYDMVFSIFTQGVYLAVLILQKLLPQVDQAAIKSSLQSCGYFFLSVVIVFLFRIPWLGDFLYWSGKTVGGSYPLDLIGNFTRSLHALTGYAPLFTGFYVILCLLGLFFAVQRSHKGGALLACWLILSIPITIIGLWYVSQFFHERHAIWSLPSFLLATACGLVGLVHVVQMGLNRSRQHPSAPAANLAQFIPLGLLILPLLLTNLSQARQNSITKQTWPIGQLQAATSYIASQAQADEVVVGVPNAQYLQLYIQPVRQDLIYLDIKSTALPPKLEGIWYVFYNTQHIPARWQQQLDFKKFNDLLIVHRSGPCQIADCLNDTKTLFLEMAEANSGTALAEKLNSMLSGLATMTISE